jgi:predicted nucleic acid-binding protein
VFPISTGTARTFGELFKELRGKGRHLSHVDIVIAALARELGAIVVTTDRDFEALPDIKTENWLV